MSLVQDIVAALSGAMSQNNRLLKLHTPLGADVLLAERLDGTEAIGPGTADLAGADGLSAGLRFTVDALSTSVYLDMKQLIGQPVLLELLTQASRTQLRPWHGHITRVAQLGSDGGLARWRLVVEPWLAFLAQRQDSWVFQDKTVREIVEEVFNDHAGQGQLVPAWRWDLADEAVYPRRSLCIQYQESDLAFVERLLREEGLFYWFEHAAAADTPALGSHTMVIADHNGAFQPNAQPVVRYTQSGASLGADSLTRWQRTRRVQAASLALASPDYRAGGLDANQRPVQASGNAAPVAGLAVTDMPGAYAYADSAQGERLVRRQMEALDAQREGAQGRGSWRSAAPATSFTLTDHPVHDGLDDKRDRHVLLAVRHRARNNLRADLKAQLQALLGADGGAMASINPALTAGSNLRNTDKAHAASKTVLPNASEEPLYECQLDAQRAAVPVRMAAIIGLDGTPDPRLHPRPTVHGVQSAIVVGLSAPVHTDRDHRIKLQFHWQRGGNGSHRLDHPGGANAPASDASGTWVRVAESVAGANWGSNFTPRLGQEVLVGFIAGDIDRPVVVGVLYNGAGLANAQGNQAAAGAATATGNAPAWFPGDQPAGRLQAHQHAAVLAGHKSQELATSQAGTGGHNQLVLDDTPGAGRIELASTSAQTRLQLGHLLQQTDNQRLQARGHGLDLATQAWGAVRAGQGLLVSAHAKPASLSAAGQMDMREPHQQLADATDMAHTLAESAHKQQARLTAEPDTVGAKSADTGRQLPFEQGLQASKKSLSGTADKDATQAGPAPGAGAAPDAAGDASSTIGGGAGTVPTLTRPDLVLAAPGGIAGFTPAHAVASAGTTITLVAGQDMQLLAQADMAVAVKSGLVFYTYGKATNTSKPNTETGIQLHAASGNVNTQSQSGATKLTADKAVDVASTTGMVQVAAPQHILLTAAGAALRIEGGNITLSGPGKVEFKAAMKELAGPGRADLPSLLMPKHQGDPGDQHFVLASHDGQPIANRRYRVQTGNQSMSGITDASGKTETILGFVGQAARFELLPDYCQRFAIKDDRGNPLVGYPYKMTSQSGITFIGTTDHKGMTDLLYSPREENVEIVYHPQDFPESQQVG